MDTSIIANYKEKELLDAQAHIWTHIFGYHYSMALKCALELGVPDAVHNHGKPLTLIELADVVSIHSSKVGSFHRLMRLLCHSNLFSLSKLPNGEPIYDLTINSKLLVKDHPLSLTPFVSCVFEPTVTNPAYHLSSWFKNDDETPFHTIHGKGIWEHGGSLIESFDERCRAALASDSRFVSNLLETNCEFKSVFSDIESLVDVGGSDGTMAKAIVKANPGLKCIVFDLPHVVNGIKKDEGDMLTYVAGDMFEAIPPANAVLLKWVLHDWNDERCVKILERCKEAIPKRDKGGKVIIIDMVIERESDCPDYRTIQYVFDMMNLTINGKQRNEQEWKKLFIGAGFQTYKIFPILGLRSIIEVYPF